MKKSIVWEVWQSPLDSLLQEPQQQENQQQPEYSDGYDESQNFMGQQPNGKYIITQFGAIPVDNITESVNHNFNFWVMHTNFDLTDEIVDKIQRVPGVEILKIFSRYRAMVGFGKHPSWGIRDIKDSIFKELCQEEPKDNASIDIDDKIGKLIAKYATDKVKHFCIFCLPNLNIVSYYTNIDNDEKYIGRVRVLQELNSNINGIFLTDKDVN